jgi:hypothetical protein
MGKRGPKAKGLNAEAERQIGELAAQGIRPAEIATRLGLAERTVSRRVAALQGPSKPRASSDAAPVTSAQSSASEGDEGVDDDEGDAELPNAEAIPPNSSLEQIDGWLAKAEAAIAKAEAVPNLPLVSNLLRTAAQLADMRRKMTPPEVPDLNEHPDYVKLGAQVRERLHKMVDLVCEESRQG